MKDLKSIVKKYSSVEYNRDNYSIGAGWITANSLQEDTKKQLTTKENNAAQLLKKAVGHKSFNSFIRYIRCDNIEVALRIAKHDFFK